MGFGWTFDFAEAREWAVNIILALLILVVAHFAAKVVKWAVAKGVDRIPFFSRRDSARPGGIKPMTDVGERVGEVAYWIVWLVGLIVALGVFGESTRAILAPLSDMLTNFVRYIPNVVGAALIFFIGFVLATIVRRMVEATVQAIELDQRLVDAGLTHTPRGPGLARLLGILVFTLIIIPVAIAALDALAIQSISQPAVDMLRQILDAIPRVIAAVLIIFIAYLVGRWVGTLAEEGLNSISFDAIVDSISQARSVREGLNINTPANDTPTPARTFPPSRLVGIAVLVGIILFAAIEAARVLSFGAMAQMLSEVLALATQVLFGAVIIAVGVLIANILSAAAARGGDPSSEIMSVLVKWGVIALSVAVGLRFMGLANDIIVLAFGLILGSVAVAVAIAFGVGGRDAARRLLARWTGGES
ncbi:MAG: mechanosensitive ion channel [Hyphomonadaceae bacterium]|nr:mechanosensitive ion channel [Hyphomonadaceae bacterium]